MKYTKNWRFNVEETNYLNSTPNNSKNDKRDKISLIQICQDLTLSHNFRKIIINNSEDYFECVAPNITYYSFWMWILIIPRVLKDLSHFIIREEWKILYKKFGIKIYYSAGKISPFKKLLNFILAIKFFINLKDGQELLNHVFKEIKCGDLIYDSFIRFNKKSTLNVNDFTLILYIYDCYNQIDYFTELASVKKIEKYYSTYSTYISHGIPVRVFLSKGIKVFIIGYSTFELLKIKELTETDDTQVSPHWSYRKIFSTLENKHNLIKIGLRKIEKRLKGFENLEYMRVNQFDFKSSLEFDSKFDGVLFIGDFFDSQHIYRSMVFEDLYNWLIYTINLTLEFKLNIGFKPHPNQLPESEVLINKIRKKYPDIKWINANTPNNQIFDSGIEFGISVYGTVLSELAYHKIKPICCGDNPCSNYDFIFEAKTKKDYKAMILGNKKLEFKNDFKDKLGECVYMDKIYFSKFR